MATTTVGTGETYTTWTSWEASLSTAQEEIGEGKDELFSERVTINATAPTSIKMRAVSGAEHDGTAGSGARIDNTVNGFSAINFTLSVAAEVSDLEIINTQASGDGIRTVGTSSTGTLTCMRLLYHDIPRS